MFFRFNIPAYATLIALYGLGGILFLKGDKVFMVITYMLSIIGITIALSQTCFDYSHHIETKKQRTGIIEIAKRLMASSVWASISLILFCLDYYINQYIVSYSNHFVIQAIHYLLVIFILLNFTLSAEGIYKSINNLGYFLWFDLDILAVLRPIRLSAVSIPTQVKTKL